jgi:hypothetical protein
MIRIHKAMKTFTIEATFGDQILRSAAPIDIVDRSIAEWTEKFDVMPADEARSAVRQLVVDTLMNERHVNDPIEQQLTSAALVWLAATGPHGKKLTELMKLGDMAIGYDITRISATAFNFRMSVDEKTLAEISGRTN